MENHEPVLSGLENHSRMMPGLSGVLIYTLPVRQSEPESGKINSEPSSVQNLRLREAQWELSPEEVASGAERLAWLWGAWTSHHGAEVSPLNCCWVDVISTAICGFSPRQDPGVWLRNDPQRVRSNLNEMSKNVPGQAASGQVDLGVFQEEGQCLGQGVQLEWTGILQEVALPHEVMLEEMLTHTLVQLPHQAQEPPAEHLPVLGIGVLLTSPEEHRLRKQEVVSDIVLGHWGQCLQERSWVHVALGGGDRSPRVLTVDSGSLASSSWSPCLFGTFSSDFLTCYHLAIWKLSQSIWGWDGITNSMDMNLSKLWEIVEDRGAAVHQVTNMT